MKKILFQMIQTRTLVMICGWCLLLVSCKQDQQDDHLDSSAPAPQAIDRNSISHRDIAGGAVIQYRLPKDENLLYVKAIYETAPGIVREVKASLYVDSLVVEGFATAGTYNVSLYTVGKNEKESEAIIYSVTTKPAPLQTAWESLEVSPVFGGVRGTYENETQAPLTVVLSADTTGTGIYTLLRAFTGDEILGLFVYLEMDTVATPFSVYMKDRWGNRTESREFIIQPAFEEVIPKPWEKYVLPSDNHEAVQDENLYGMFRLWDGSTGRQNCFGTKGDARPFPYHFTFKLGVTAIISRMMVRHRDQDEYKGSTVKKLELWGSGSDNPDDDLLLSGDWFQLGTWFSQTPSGNINTAATADDKLYATSIGEPLYVVPTAEIPDPYRPVKFLRVRVFEVWSGSLAGQMIIGELDLFGQVQEE